MTHPVLNRLCSCGAPLPPVPEGKPNHYKLCESCRKARVHARNVSYRIRTKDQYKGNFHRFAKEPAPASRSRLSPIRSYSVIDPVKIFLPLIIRN